VVEPPPPKYESQLGWLFPRYGKIKHFPNHQPDNVAPNQTAHMFSEKKTALTLIMYPHISPWFIRIPIKWPFPLVQSPSFKRLSQALFPLFHGNTRHFQTGSHPSAGCSTTLNFATGYPGCLCCWRHVTLQCCLCHSTIFSKNMTYSQQLDFKKQRNWRLKRLYHKITDICKLYIYTLLLLLLIMY